MTGLHLFPALVCKIFHCKSLNKCPHNKKMPLALTLGETSRAKTVVLPHVLEKEQQNWAILELVTNLFLNISFLLRKVNNLPPNLASCMMFWAVNLKPFPCLPGGVSPFGSPTSHRCPQNQMHPRQTARTTIWFSRKGFSREKRQEGRVSFASPAALAHSKSWEHKPENCWVRSCHPHSPHGAGAGQRWGSPDPQGSSHPQHQGDPSGTFQKVQWAPGTVPSPALPVFVLVLKMQSSTVPAQPPQLWQGPEAQHGPSLALWPRCDGSLHHSTCCLSFITLVAIC